MDREADLIKEIRSLIKEFQKNLPEDKRKEIFDQIILLTGILIKKK
ncbi:hypothetical protein ACJROX_22520 [Pseudalkalibacillus sp. A8]